MRNTLLTLVLGCVLVLSLAHPGFGQDVNSNQKKSAFLEDLNLARKGDREAKLRVARAYNEGFVVWRNAPEAAWWFQQASDEGSVEATAWLGAMYLFGGNFGGNVPRDIPRAHSLLQKAVDANNPIGLRFMAAKYQFGIGTVKDPVKAIEFYSRAIALHDPESHSRLARMYLIGEVVPRDTEKALSLLAAGAQLGDQWSQLSLGQWYVGSFAEVISKSPTGATKPDYEKARELLTAAASQGNRVAQYELGRMYESGLGVTVDYSKSFEYYKQSSMQRYGPADFALGRAHELGRGTPVNLLHAHVAYSLAVENTNSRQGKNDLLRIDSSLSPGELKTAERMLKAFKEASEAAFGRSVK